MMSKDFDFKTELKNKAEEAEIIIKQYLFDENGEQRTVFEACNYSVLAGGKRLRPILMKETFRLFKTEPDAALEKLLGRFMTALEMIHTYSLVHDDLPAMDNDMYRRGKLTTHAKFGHAMGVLAGDALLNYAFECVADALLETDETDLSKAAKALKVLSNKAGVYGMLGGQVVDVEETGKEINLSKLDFIYRLKTGALLEAAMMCGAILGGASEKEVEVAGDIASLMGKAFQYCDDVLDVTSTEEVLGKPIGSDAKNNKTTSVTFFGTEGALEKAEEAYKKALELLDTLPGDKEFLRELFAYMVHRDR